MRVPECEIAFKSAHPWESYFETISKHDSAKENSLNLAP
jgi:hypothetical protein